MQNQILIAKKDFIDINLKTLVAKNEFVKCVDFSVPITGTLYTLKVGHFGTDNITELKLDWEGVRQFEITRIPIIAGAYF